MPVIRVLVADDHAILRAGLRVLIDAERDMQVVGEAADGHEAVRRAAAGHPDVVTLDLAMPGPTAGRVIRMLRNVVPAARVLILTMQADPTFAEAFAASGADGYATKDEAPERILRAIRVLAAGGRSFAFLEGDETDDAQPSAAEHCSLTPRELQIAGMIAGGHSYQDIARELRIGLNSVATYRQRAAKKLGVRRRADLVRAVLEAGWVIRRTDAQT